VDTVPDSEIESNLTDRGGIPLGEGVDYKVTAALACRIMPQNGVPAFNSAA
jgi:hypothetical protein